MKTLLLVTALVWPDAAGEGNRAIASRSVEPGDAQYPWLLRLDDEDHAVAGVNHIGSEIALCRTAAPLPREAWSRVAVRWDGEAIALDVGGQTTRCPAPGKVARWRGVRYVGALFNAANLSNGEAVHERFSGCISDLVVDEGEDEERRWGESSANGMCTSPPYEDVALVE